MGITERIVSDIQHAFDTGSMAALQVRALCEIADQLERLNNNLEEKWEGATLYKSPDKPLDTHGGEDA